MGRRRDIKMDDTQKVSKKRNKSKTQQNPRVSDTKGAKNGTVSNTKQSRRAKGQS